MKRYLVVGMARSGVAAALLLAKKGFQVRINDSKPLGELGEALDCLKGYENVEWRLGMPAVEAMDGVDEMIVSPGISVESALVKAAEEKGIAVTGELELGYRTSVFSRLPWLVTGARLKLEKGDQGEIRAKMADLAQRRRSKQPLEYPSAGSTFKRPVGHFAGGLIEQCGLKGTKVGGAQVSEKHAGFVINAGGATCRDILALIRLVRATVLEQTGVTLEPEVRLLGCALDEES